MIRLATPEDGAAIARIYNQNVTEGSFANCDLTRGTAEERATRLAASEPRFPTFVHEGPGGAVVGWASLKRFSARPYYADVAEIAVYVDSAHRARLVGAALMLHLLGAACAHDFRTLIAIILEKNKASIRGALAAGFEPLATLHQAAYLRGQWVDILWLARDLTSDADSIAELYASRFESTPTTSSKSYSGDSLT